MPFEFDSDKNLLNQKQHGIGFDETQKLWLSPHVIVPTKNVSGENRSAIIGKVRGKVYVAIFTERQDNIRLISCHRADKKWEEIFNDHIKKNKE